MDERHFAGYLAGRIEDAIDAACICELSGVQHFAARIADDQHPVPKTVLFASLAMNDANSNRG
jgi:hypothetical protein